MRTLTLDPILRLHARVIGTSGGGAGLRDLGRLQSAIAQRLASYDVQYLYPDLVSKAVALAYSLIQGHPFIDGNKRIGHAAMEVMLLLNGFELDASVDEQERIILAVAAGETEHEAFASWVRSVVKPQGE